MAGEEPWGPCAGGTKSLVALQQGHIHLVPEQNSPIHRETPEMEQTGGEELKPAKFGLSRPRPSPSPSPSLARLPQLQCHPPGEPCRSPHLGIISPLLWDFSIPEGGFCSSTSPELAENPWRGSVQAEGEEGAEAALRML